MAITTTNNIADSRPIPRRADTARTKFSRINRVEAKPVNTMAPKNNMMESLSIKRGNC